MGVPESTPVEESVAELSAVPESFVVAASGLSDESVDVIASVPGSPLSWVAPESCGPVVPSALEPPSSPDGPPTVFEEAEEQPSEALVPTVARRKGKKRGARVDFIRAVYRRGQPDLPSPRRARARRSWSWGVAVHIARSWSCARREGSRRSRFSGGRERPRGCLDRAR